MFSEIYNNIRKYYAYTIIIIIIERFHIAYQFESDEWIQNEGRNMNMKHLGH